MSAQEGRIRLPAALLALRREIREAAQQAQNAEPKFRINTIELELTAVAETSAEAGGEVGWWILKGSAKADAKEGQTHKVKLTLNVKDIDVRSITKTK
jgi:hypothetical protein